MCKYNFKFYIKVILSINFYHLKTFLKIKHYCRPKNIQCQKNSTFFMNEFCIKILHQNKNTVYRYHINLYLNCLLRVWQTA